MIELRWKNWISTWRFWKKKKEKEEIEDEEMLETFIATHSLYENGAHIEN